MNTWLLKKLTGEKENDRFACGMAAQKVGIFCNLLLFAIKLTLGLLSGAVSVISDAFNNLSDLLSCAIAFAGYKAAGKPADEDHPFGHGRMEYVIAFLAAVFIFITGWTVLKEGVSSILSPKPLTFEVLFFIPLLLSVGVKAWMRSFYLYVGRKSESTALLASAQDSLDDVLSTSMTIAAMILSRWLPKVPVDGIAGTIISLFIFASGYEIARDIIDSMLGKPVDPEMAGKIRNIILSFPEAEGVHDILLHEYGPGNYFGTAHIEIDSEESFLTAHEVADRAEREIARQLHVRMTLHMDPVDYDKPIVNTNRSIVWEALRKLDPHMSMHDFQTEEKENGDSLHFDVVVPYECKLTHQEIKNAVVTALKEHGRTPEVAITFDREYIAKRENG